MAGKCIICNNLIGKRFFVDEKEFDGCGCSKGKFKVDGVEHYYSTIVVAKEGKSLKKIEEICDSWDDRLKSKKVE